MSFLSQWKLIALIFVSLLVLQGARGCGGSQEPEICTSDSMCADGYACTAGECVVKPEGCAANNGGCEQGCSDWDGGYECSCDAGFRLADDGSSCDNINECTASPVKVSGAGLEDWNATFTRVEDECGFRGDGCRFNYRLLGTEKHLFTNEGGYWVLDTVNVGSSYRAAVVDDEMTPPSVGWEVVDGFGGGPAPTLSFPEAPCAQNSLCTDTEGSYECECQPGYRAVGDTCENINECTASPVLISGAGLPEWNATFTRVEDECGFRGDGCRFNYRLLGTDQHIFTNNGGYWVLDTQNLGSYYRAPVIGDEMAPPMVGWEVIDGVGSGSLPNLSFPWAPCAQNDSCTDTDGSYECW